MRFIGLILCMSFCFGASQTFADSYAVVVSKKTLKDPDWKKVVDVLVERHQGTVITYDNVRESLEPLKKHLIPVFEDDRNAVGCPPINAFHRPRHPLGAASRFARVYVAFAFWSSKVSMGHPWTLDSP